MKPLFILLLPITLCAQQLPDEVITSEPVVDKVINYGHNASEEFHATSVRENYNEVAAHDWKYTKVKWIPNGGYLVDNFRAIRTCLYCQRKEAVHDTLIVRNQRPIKKEGSLMK